MTTLIATGLGEALPPQPRHAVTVHLPKWQSIVRFADRDPELMKQLKSMYPRMILHRDVKELCQVFLKTAGYDPATYSCAPYTASITAQQCKAFATSPARGEDVAKPEEIEIKLFDIDIRYYIVFFPISKTAVTHPFWAHSGLGTSSRQAEHSLNNISKLKAVKDDELSPKPELVLSQAHDVVKKRVADLLERAPAPGRLTNKKVKSNDVYLFQTGMASIYSVHTWLLDHLNHKAKSILFGFAFHHTIHVFNFFGPEYKFLGKGDDADIDILEAWLKEEKQKGTRFQALWAEYPSNPLIITPNSKALRRLADEYGFLLILDDTIGSFSNVDLLGFADVIVTSLTKSFSGFADVMGASAVINPSSSRYVELKELFDRKHQNEYSNPDVEQIEKNSRTYLQRSTILNNNALRLVEHFQSLAADPSSCVSQVFYTTIGPDFEYYKQTMRQVTEEFTPGYGCLFTIEFQAVSQTKAFFDNVNVHHGPHLGAHLTIALPYVRTLYNKELEWAAGYNMRPTQIRIAVGLEDINELLKSFNSAVEIAQRVEPSRSEE